MLLFAGLGNPGTKYAGNRHNVGFMAVERIAEAHAFGPARSKFEASVREGVFALPGGGRKKALLLRPQTFYNEAGRAVGQAARFFGIPLSDIIVFHDELDLAPGKIRVKTGGGAAGNNGIKSIAAHIGADFRRVRIGIGHPGAKDAVTRWVLNDFPKAEQEGLRDLLGCMAKAAPHLAAGDDPRFMSEVAQGFQALGYGGG